MAQAPHATGQATPGFAMLEALVALLVVSAGVTALVRAQTGLWRSVDHSRDRALALRAAQADLEQARWFSRLAPAPGAATSEPAWRNIANTADAALTGQGGEPTLVLTRSVVTRSQPPLKAVTARVQWTDRLARPQTLALSTLIEATDPRWGAWLALAPGGAAGAARLLRSNLPVQAQDLGDGRSVWRPLPGLAAVWLFEHRFGTVTHHCVAPASTATGLLRTNDLSGCTASSGLLLAGVIRFATTTPTPSASDAEIPHGPALPLSLRLTLTEVPAGQTPAAWTCQHDAPATLPAAPTTAVPGSGGGAVHYACLVQINPITADATAPPRWSGRLDLVPVGWALATGASDTAATHLRICRYSADTNANGRIDNAEHPASYSHVDAPLLDQNFLVIQSAARCPVEPAAQRQGADDSTVAHQP